ncbi:MAG: D-alanine--D-alanine ligase [Burkholderiaceae bacterium]|nr:D-alanine--D-alanine ligase [Burkholderiaceae bacterium]
MTTLFSDKYAHFGKVAVLMGGRSAEREVSLLSGNAVLKALQAQGVDAFAFDPYEKDIFTLKQDKFERCFIALHGRYGEDGTIQGALELMSIPYTGSGVMASSVAMNKVMTKRIWQSMGLPTPNWMEVSSVEETRKALAQLGSPMIVKPAREGSTIGLTKVTSLAQCEEAYSLAAHQDSIVLCEQYISGDEVTCTVLDDAVVQTQSNKYKSAQALPIIRIVAPAGNYDYQNKYFANDTQYIIPCGLPDGEETNIQDIVLKSYHALECRGWARADVMIDRATRKPYLLEINTAPGMTSHSLVPMSAKEFGLSFDMLCIRVLESASLDYADQSNARKDDIGQGT